MVEAHRGVGPVPQDPIERPSSEFQELETGPDVPLLHRHKLRRKERGDGLALHPPKNLPEGIEGGFALTGIKVEIDIDGVDPARTVGAEKGLGDVQIAVVGALPVVGQDIVVHVAVEVLEVGADPAKIREDEGIGGSIVVESGIRPVEVVDAGSHKLLKCRGTWPGVSAPLEKTDGFSRREKMFVDIVDRAANLRLQVQTIVGDLDVDRPLILLFFGRHPVKGVAEGVGARLDIGQGKDLSGPVDPGPGSLHRRVDLASNDRDGKGQGRGPEDFPVEDLCRHPPASVMGEGLEGIPVDLAIEDPVAVEGREIHPRELPTVQDTLQESEGVDEPEGMLGIERGPADHEGVEDHPPPGGQHLIGAFQPFIPCLVALDPQKNPIFRRETHQRTKGRRRKRQRILETLHPRVPMAIIQVEGVGIPDSLALEPHAKQDPVPKKAGGHVVRVALRPLREVLEDGKGNLFIEETRDKSPERQGVREGIPVDLQEDGPVSRQRRRIGEAPGHLPIDGIEAQVVEGELPVGAKVVGIVRLLSWTVVEDVACAVDRLPSKGNAPPFLPAPGGMGEGRRTPREDPEEKKPRHHRPPSFS